jgi:hypothetical protein
VPIRHNVKTGDGLSRLAAQYGFSPARIWDDPANAGLRARRPDPNILLPGDVVVIPDLEAKSVAAATGLRHRFRRSGVPALFRIQFLDDGRPRSGESYRLTIGDRAFTGTTDADGRIELFVPNDAATGVLLLGDTDEMEIDFGAMDPLEAASGIRKRLRNLGLYDGDDEDGLGPATRRAIETFQARAGLPVTGEADAATLAKLQELHDTSATFAAAD